MKYVITILLSIYSLIASPSAVILTTQGEAPYLAQTVRTKLMPVLSADIYTIRNTYDISKIISNRPEIIILTSEKATRTYLQYRPKSDNTIPLVAVSDHENYKELSSQIKNGTLLVNGTSSEELFEHLAKFTGKIPHSVGYLFSESYKEEALTEMYQLKKSGIITHSQRVNSSDNSDKVKTSLKKLKRKGATIIRILGDDALLTLIEKDDVIRKYLAKNSSVVISDKTDLHHSLTSSVVVTVRENKELFSGIIALVTQAAYRSGTADYDFEVIANIASLHYGKVKHFSLMKQRPLLLDALDEAILSIDTTTSRTAIWSEVFAITKNIADTVVGIPSNQRIFFEDTAKGLDKVLFYRFTVRDVIYLVGITLLILVFIRALRRHVLRIKASRPTAILYPKRLKRITLSNPNGRNKKLVLYLKRDKYQFITAHSITQYRRKINKIAPRVHIVDWEYDHEAVQFLHNMIRDRAEMAKDVFIIFNLPKKSHLEVAPRFGEMSLHLYEKYPTTEELDKVFYGSGKQEQKVSYISGTLDEEALPPIFQMLETNKTNGVLLIEDPAPFSAIFYRDGMIVYAEDRLGNSREKALYEALSKKEGNFRFEVGNRSPVENVSIRSMDLLMNWAAYVDEAHL